MFFNKKHSLSLLLLWLSQLAFGQELKQLWEQTTQYYQGFEVKKQQILLAKQDSISRLIPYKPQMQVQWQQGLSSLAGTTGAFIPLPGIMNISGSSETGNSPVFNHFLSGSFSWDIVHFGKKDLDKAWSESLIHQQEIDQEVFEVQIQQQLIKRYLTYRYYVALANWFQDHQARYESILEISIGLSQAGLRPGADTLLAKSSLLQVKSALNSLEGQLKGVKSLIQEFTGDPFYAQDATKKDAFLAIIPSLGKPEKRHPELKLKAAEAAGYALQEKRSNKDRLPKIQLLGGLANRSSTIGTQGQLYASYGRLYDRFANNYYVGFGATWSLQDLFKGNSQQKSWQLQQNRSLQEGDLRESAIQMQKDNLEAQLEAKAQSIEETNKSLTEAEEAYQLYKTRFEGGLINLSELLQVQDVLLKIENQQLSSYFAYWTLLTDLSYQKADFSPLFHHF